MLPNNNIEEIKKLSVEERILAVQQIWDSISEDSIEGLNNEQRQMLEKRWTSYQADKTTAIPWQKARQMIADRVKG